MISPLKILSFARQCRRTLPQGLCTAKAVVAQAGRHWLQGRLAQFDLIDRQQFEGQEQQVKRLREQLVQLEQQIALLEKQWDRAE